MKRRLFTLGVVSIMLLSSCQLGRFVWYNFSDITDYTIFPSRPLTASSTPFSFYKDKQNRIGPKSVEVNGKSQTFEAFLKEHKTVAFMVVRNDSILYEEYFAGYDSASIIASFSMAKSYTSALIGCAIDDGLILNVNEPITKYIPEMTQNGFDKVTIKHLLQMTSGIAFNESYYNPFGDAATFYYGRQLDKKTLKLKLSRQPGTQFEYTSGSTQLLGLVLARALKTESITAYFERKLWKPMNMEFSGSWSIDKKNGREKTFCCMNARARDFAKFGRLFLNKGNWNGTQLISASWIEESTKADRNDGGVPYYKYQWWLETDNLNQYCAQGHLGQYIFVDKAKNIIIIRLGSGYGNIDWTTIASSLANKLP
jgi:CubicO group peptidase (beta-lactamase class C family)